MRLRAPPTPGRQHHALLLGIAAAAVNLRIAVIGLPPLLDTIRRDLHMSNALAGLIPTVPFVCTGVVALVTVQLMKRISHRDLITSALVLIGSALVLRSLMPSALALVLMTVPLGLGIGILTVTLPSVVKRSFAEIGGGATGTYLTASGLGAAAAGFLAVPLARAFGWRASLAIGAIPALLALPYWLRATGGPGAPASRERPSSGNSWPSDERLTLVVLTTAFVCQSAGFSGTISWLAALYEHAGWSADRAGVATGVAVALSVPAAALIPRRSDGGDRRRWVAVMAGMSACGILGFALDPRGLPWAWLSLFGVGNGALFPLILALVLDHAADEHEAAVLTRWTWGAGSLLAGFTPLLIGAMRDTAISFSTAFTILAACAAASGVLAMTLGRRTSNP